MNVFDVLKQDHQTVRTLFSRIEQTGSGFANTRRELFETLKDELIRHTKAEQQVFYPQLENRTQTHDDIEDAWHEHDRINTMLEQISGLPPDSEDWVRAVRELKDCVEHHVHDEEDKIFPKARDLLPGEQLDRMGDRLQDARH